IRFLLKRKETADAVLASLADASHLYKILKEEFNLSTKQFSEISENRETWTDARIQQAVEYTRFKLEAGRITRSPAGYLMRALRENYSVSGAERTMVKVQAKKASDKTQAEIAKAEAQRSVARSNASREEEARTRMNEESRKGCEHFNSVDAKTRK